MLRILVVDDETIVLESVSQVLKSNFDEVQIETAKNSREGLIKVEHFRPHIIMSDIKMPGMSGLEFIERIRKVNQLVKIIIVSAYDHFEFAKEAVKYNIEDYILKPLTKHKLIEVISQTAEKVMYEEEQLNKELDHIEKYYQSAQLVESNFFNSILLNRNFIKYISHYSEILDVPFEKGSFITVEFDKLSSDTDSNEINSYNQKLNDCGDFIKANIKYQMTTLVSNPFLNRIFIYIEGDHKKNDRIFWYTIVQQVLDRFKLRTRIGMGTVKDINQLSESYTESLLALRISEEPVISMVDIRSTSASNETFDDSRQELYTDFIQRNKTFKNTLKHFEGEYLKMLNSKSTLEYAEATLIELMILMHFTSKNCIVKPKIDEMNRHFLSDLLTKSAVIKLQYFEKIVSEWFALYAKMQNDTFNAITIRVIDQLKNTYANDISLEDIASSMNITPQYLSKIFKEDTGTTFKEYLTEQRIEASKALLKRCDVSIKDICFKVGYNDTSYFIRAFKKFEGLTPKDYQRINR